MADESNNSTELSEIDPLPENRFNRNGGNRRVSQWNITPIEGAEWQQNSENDWHDDCRPLFIEMLELVEDLRGKLEWREAARWIKYEESVEPASERWSKPYVPSLNYPSVQTLRNLLLSNTVELDMSAEDVKSIFVSITNEWGHPELLKLLTRRHVHLYERAHSMLEDVIPNYGKSRQVERSRKISQAVSANGGATDGGKKKSNTSFMKKIPSGAEACNILVGEVDYLDEPLSAFVRLRKPVLLGNITEVAVPTRFVLVILAPKDRLQEFTQVGRAMGALMSDPNFKNTAYNANTNVDLVNGIDLFLRAVTLLPPAGWDSNIRIEPVGKEQHPHGEEGEVELHEGLARTGRLFGGLVQDIKRKLPWYRSDFTDALSLQCLATWLFLYFACLTPMITFGGILGEATDNQMGTMEVMVSGCLCGVVFALFSGQPLLILGSTGPMLIFEKIIIQVTESFEFEYMEFRVWIGIWVGVILLILVATDASAFVTYITRFTEENFATLVACIFIYEAVKNLIHIKDPEDDEGPENETNHTGQRPLHDGQPPPLPPGTFQDSDLFIKDDRGTIFLTSIILFFATFAISFALKEFRSTRFFPTRVRYIVSDFAVIIAIVVVAAIDLALDIDTPKLKVPEKFAPTIPDRGWLINPIKENDLWTIGVAIVPAMLATILIFMDQQITAVILNRKDHKLKKGAGYHLDLLVIAVLIVICSFLGLPWFIAATVESLTNLNSLKTESESAAPGEKPQFLGVREQRVTNILVFTTVGLSVLFTSVLKVVPMPVLYGVFLYMGISALRRMELYERVLLFFMPSKYQPDCMYLRNVKIVKVHLFTGIQVLSLVVLWVIKSVQATSIGFPLMLLVMMLLRKLLEYVFTLEELASLDDLLPGTRVERHPRGSKSSKGAAAIGNGNAHTTANDKAGVDAMV